MAKYLIFPLLVILCACGKAPQSAQTDAFAPSVLAKVGGEEITQEDFDLKAQNLDESFRDFIKTPAGRDNFLDLMISEKLLIKEAKKEDLEDDENYKKQIADLQKEQQQRLASAKEFGLMKLLNDKLEKEGTLAVSEEDIKTYYKKYPYQIYLLQILVADPQLAADLTKELKGARSAARFQEAVRKFSIDPATKDDGGRLAPFIPGEYISEIEVSAANTPAMQVQGFFKTAQGFHIIMKTDEESLTYAQAKDRIKQILERQKMDAYLNSLKEKYGVEVKYESK